MDQADWVLAHYSIIVASFSENAGLAARREILHPKLEYQQAMKTSLIYVGTLLLGVAPLQEAVKASLSSSQAAAPARQSTERTLELADYAEMPVTGEKSTNLITGQLARGGILVDEPGGRRFFVTDLNGLLYILNKQTKQFTPYLNFNGSGDRAGLFPKFTAAQGYAAGLMNFVFDPDYARNGVFYTLHM